MSEARIVIGLHATREVLKVRPRKVSALFLRERWKESEDLRELSDLAREHGVPLKQVPSSFLDKYGRSHQGIGLEVAESPALDLKKIKDKKTALIVVLDQVEDPQNLGAILRTAWLMDADAVVIPRDRSSPLTPTVAKIASGAMEHVPVAVVTNLPAWLKDRREEDFWIYGFDSEGRNTFWQVEYPAKAILVLGAEGHGLRKPTIAACDEILKIPQAVAEASYNVSVSAALAMGEILRQRAGK
jgi:23S rRNA (guanosine2251-2'-O)-methyltransferase